MRPPPCGERTLYPSPRLALGDADIAVAIGLPLADGPADQGRSCGGVCRRHFSPDDLECLGSGPQPDDRGPELLGRLGLLPEACGILGGLELLHLIRPCDLQGSFYQSNERRLIDDADVLHWSVRSGAAFRHEPGG